MKRNTVRGLLGMCLLLGIACGLDLLLFTDMETGFTTVGSIWLRYGIMAVAVGVCYAVPALAARKATDALPADAQPQIQPPAVLCIFLAAACAVCCGMGLRYAVREFEMPTTMFGIPEAGALMQTVAFWMRMGLALGMMVLCVWFGLLAARSEPLKPQPSVLRAMGIIGVFTMLFLPVLRYVENPSTVYRAVLIVPIFSAVAGVWFAVQLVGVLCRANRAAMRSKLAAAGLIAFLLCTCVGVPQGVFVLWQGKANGMLLYTCLVLGLLGVLGAVTALQACDDAR